MKLSILTSLYKSDATLDEFVRRASEQARRITDDYEIVLVNDDPSENSADKALALYRADKHVRLIELSRNCGQHAALLTGLAHVQGDLVYMVDADLEEDLAWIGNFHQEMQRAGADVVFGQIKSRKGYPLQKAISALFYKIFSYLTYSVVPENTTTARLMTRQFVDALLQHKESTIFLAGLISSTGFKQVPMMVEKPYKGSSGYSVVKRVSLSVDAITSFSNIPLVLIFFFGILVSFVSGLYMTWIILLQLVMNIPVPGWTTLVVSVWFIGGVTFFFLGVIGIYLSRIYIETKHRPLSIVRKVHEHRP